MDAALAELSRVDAGYGATPALRGLSLVVRPGEAWAVLGPNGAGKSTLARVLTGLLRPSAGDARVCGLDARTATPEQLARDVAWVPQSIREDVAFTGLEVALFGRAPHLAAWGLHGANDEVKARAALDALGVGHLADRPLDRVSGGERRRVWLARALVQAPRLLVLDEPTAFLDVRHQVETLRHVRGLLSDRVGVVAVLHDPGLAAHFATHALLLKGGGVEASGPVAEVLTPARLTALYGIEMHVARESDGLVVPRWEAP